MGTVLIRADERAPRSARDVRGDHQAVPQVAAGDAHRQGEGCREALPVLDTGKFTKEAPSTGPSCAQAHRALALLHVLEVDDFIRPSIKVPSRLGIPVIVAPVVRSPFRGG